MNNTFRHPYHSAAPKLFDAYPATSEIGSIVRRSDAKLRLKEMLQAEETIRKQETMNAAIQNRMTRIRAEHELNIQYLIQFGVKASQRMEFQKVLKEVSQHGGLGLKEAATLATARARYSDQGT